MPVQASDLLAPNGPVESKLFPGEDANTVDARLNSFIATAVAQAAGYNWPDQPAEDAGVTAYALYLTFRQAYTLSLTRPAEEDFRTEVLGRVTFEDDQRQGLKDLSAFYWDNWQALSDATLENPTSPASIGIPSYQSKNEYDW